MGPAAAFSKWRWLRLASVILLVVGIAVGGWLLGSGEGRNGQAAQAAAEQTSQQHAVPVLAATAEAKDVPLIIRGIGSVQAPNTVSVKSRVDGNIVKVAYDEGQYVHAGELLVQIDPRPWQAQLEQAEANKAKDQANLENAQRDLARDAALLKTNLAVTRQQYDTQKATVDQLAPGTSLGEAVDRINQAAAQMGLPKTVQTSSQGTAQAFQSSLSTQPLLITAAIFAVNVVLGILYESFIHPVTILMSLPPASVGALLAVQLFGFDLSIFAVIGLIMLIGIVKKNAIMMIDFAIERRRHEAKSAEEAIFEAAVLRFRPIMMTTMAAIFGILPIALGYGAGAELRQPLGVAVVGGLVVSQTLTLFTIPVTYVYMERLSTWLGGFGRRRRGPAGLAPDHALVPAGNHPRPAVIHHRAAE